MFENVSKIWRRVASRPLKQKMKNRVTRVNIPDLERSKHKMDFHSSPIKLMDEKK